VVHDGSEEIESVFAAFGDRKSCNSPSKARPEGSILGGRRSQGAIYPGEDGSVSRFFYSAKASKEDRADSKHPTVKPINLMRWLIRMVTPPGGTVLDPFAGSGTTLAAAVMEGFNAIGIEKEEEYYNDIVNRMNNVKYDGEVKTEKRNSNKNQTELNFDHLTLDEKNELLEKMIRGEV
jgi:site-specific DNA-methyltransferase (adenine-specific)